MKKIGIKILKTLSYEEFESLQYLLDYEMDYDDLDCYIEDREIVALDIEDEDLDDRAEDIEVLHALLVEFDRLEIPYELYLFEKEWQSVEISQLS